jgi:putative hydrolase
MERNLESFGSLIEPFASSVVADGPAAGFMAQLSPAIIGLQVGSLVGSLANWVMASFDAGLPQEHPGPVTFIVPNIKPVLGSAGFDEREVRLWVATNEVAFRAVSQQPWIHDHLHQLASDYADAVRIDPTMLSGLMAGGSDPAAIEQAIEEAGGIEGMIGGEEAEGPRQELEAFLGAITGCARLLARRALGELAPNFDAISEARDTARSINESTSPLGLGAVPVEMTQFGDVFNQEVERRYGDDALETLWSDPSRMPSAAELRDPTAWAARVLLDGWS